VPDRWAKGAPCVVGMGTAVPEVFTPVLLIPTGCAAAAACGLWRKGRRRSGANGVGSPEEAELRDRA